MKKIMLSFLFTGLLVGMCAEGVEEVVLRDATKKNMTSIRNIIDSPNNLNVLDTIYFEAKEKVKDIAEEHKLKKFQEKVMNKRLNAVYKIKKGLIKTKSEDYRDKYKRELEEWEEICEEYITTEFVESPSKEDIKENLIDVGSLALGPGFSLYNYSSIDKDDLDDYDLDDYYSDEDDSDEDNAFLEGGSTDDYEIIL